MGKYRVEHAGELPAFGVRGGNSMIRGKGNGQRGDRDLFFADRCFADADILSNTKEIHKKKTSTGFGTTTNFNIRNINAGSKKICKMVRGRSGKTSFGEEDPHAQGSQFEATQFGDRLLTKPILVLLT